MVGLGNWLRKHWLRGVVQDVPPEIQACESCRTLSCTHARATDCEFRQHEEVAESQRRTDIVEEFAALPHSSVRSERFEIRPPSNLIAPESSSPEPSAIGLRAPSSSQAESGYRVLTPRPVAFDERQTEPSGLVEEDGAATKRSFVER